MDYFTHCIEIRVFPPRTQKASAKTMFQYHIVYECEFYLSHKRTLWCKVETANYSFFGYQCYCDLLHTLPIPVCARVLTRLLSSRHRY